MTSSEQGPSAPREPHTNDPRESAGARLSPLIAAGLLVLLCLACSAWNWLRPDNLLWGDHLRWMSEARRAANGELIYRDFASMYPPLWLLITSTAYRWFGATFAVTNLLIDLLSTFTVLVTWRLALHWLDDRLALAVTVVFAALGATNSGTWALFSLTLYTPAILLGAIGLGLTLLSVLDLLADDTRAAPKGLLVLGVTIALLSKLEHGLATCLTMAALAFCRLPAERTVRSIARWAARYLLLGVTSMAPAALGYALIARATGADNLLAGISGYGIAAQFCPLWPNGLGLLGGVAALGLPAAFLAALALYYGRPWHGRSFRLGACLIVILAGTAVWAYHLQFVLAEFKIAQPTLSGFRLFAGYCFSMSGLLAPFMWSTTILVIFMTVRVLRSMRASSPSRRDATLLILLVPLTVLASRGMFGAVFGNCTSVHQAAYSLLVPFAPYLLLYSQDLIDATSSSGAEFRTPAPPALRARPSRRAWKLLAFVGLAFTVPRIAKAVIRPPAPVLETLAGRIYMADPASRDAYAYVLSHTHTTDRILELPIGGGLAFATHRLPATHTTQFNGLLTPERLMRLDADLVRAHPPELVFAVNTPNLGAIYGVCALTACTFPRLVWRSDRLACDPNQGFEVLDYVRAHYQPRARFGMFVALQRSSRDP